MTEVSLTPVAGITSTTNGTYVAVQPIGSTQPQIVEIFGKGLGTSGAFSITYVIESGSDGSTFGTTNATITIAGTAESKPIALQTKVSLPFVRARVTAISGTGAALVLGCRF
jgi:hypothetical protein